MAFLHLKKAGNQMTFQVTDIDLSIMNCIRRVILSDIPNVAIRFDPYNEADHDVHISTNTGPLHNEILSHRMSLIPICLSANEIRTFQKTHYKFMISKKNTSNDMMNVTTDDINIIDFEGKELSVERKRSIFPKDPVTGDHILIAKLKPNVFDKENGDELELVAHATVGCASQNAAWSPVSMCSFYNNIDDDAADAAFKEKVAALKATREVSEHEKKELRTRFDTLEKFKYFKKNRFGEANNFTFTVESECAMTPEYLVFKALYILCDMLQDLMRNIQNQDVIEISPIGEIPHMYQILLKGQTHTMGNLLQAQFYNKYVRRDGGKELEYVGYICPHPLEKTILIKLKFTPAVREENIEQWVFDSLQTIRDDLFRLGMHWIAFASVGDEYDDVVDFKKMKADVIEVADEPEADVTSKAAEADVISKEAEADVISKAAEADVISKAIAQTLASDDAKPKRARKSKK